MAAPQLALAVGWDNGAGDGSWYSQENWGGDTLPAFVSNSINNAAVPVVFDPATQDVSDYLGYTGGIAALPQISAYAANDPAQPGGGGGTMSGSPSFVTRPFPSPNTNYTIPNAYVDPPKSTYVTGRLSIDNSLVELKSGYLYFAHYNAADNPTGPFYGTGSPATRIEAGSSTGNTTTIRQTGGTLDLRYGQLRLSGSGGTSNGGGVTTNYEFRGGYLAAGTHTATNGDVKTGNNGPRSGGGAGNDTNWLGFRFGGGATSNQLTATANAANFTTYYDSPGTVWTQTMVANSSSNAKSAVTYGFHYGARNNNPNDRGVTPIFVENTYRWNTEKNSLTDPAARTDDRGVFLDFQLDSAVDIVETSPGSGTYRPKDLPLIALAATATARDGNNGQTASAGTIVAGGIQTGTTIIASSIQRQYAPFRLDALGSTGALSLLLENSASAMITRTFGGFEYKWQLTYFGNIDQSGNVSRTFGSYGNNDIVLLGISTTAVPVPEPAAMATVAIGAIGVAMAARRRRVAAT
ncbi:PEP-CTERM sorting domain-containing protein [Lacipirellula sp.]|uniref:PEP-CTERM sorting domain-containing protein n=1 Tax=Lacipirellula sp. TaxID=2691419 RepID=UPI003D122684